MSPGRRRRRLSAAASILRSVPALAATGEGRARAPRTPAGTGRAPRGAGTCSWSLSRARNSAPGLRPRPATPDQCVTTLGADSLSRRGPGEDCLCWKTLWLHLFSKNLFPPGFHPLLPLFGDQENKCKSSLLERAKRSYSSGHFSCSPSKCKDRQQTSDFEVSSSSHPLFPYFFSIYTKQLRLLKLFFSTSSFLSKTTHSPNSLQNETFFCFPSSFCKEWGKFTILRFLKEQGLRERADWKALYSEGVFLFHYSYSRDDRPQAVFCVTPDQAQLTPHQFTISEVSSTPRQCLTLSVGRLDIYFFLLTRLSGS